MFIILNSILKHCRKEFYDATKLKSGLIQSAISNCCQASPRKEACFLVSEIFFLFKHFIHAKWKLAPFISKQIKTTVYSYLDKTKEGLFKYFKTVSTDQPFDPLRQLTPTP